MWRTHSCVALVRAASALMPTPRVRPFPTFAQIVLHPFEFFSPCEDFSASSASSALRHRKAQVLLPPHSLFWSLFFAFLRGSACSALKPFLRSFGCGYAALRGSQSWRLTAKLPGPRFVQNAEM